MPDFTDLISQAKKMQEKMKDTFGKETVRWFQSAGFVISIMSGRFWSQYFSDWFGPKIDEAYFEVDTDSVLQSKKLTDGLPFVSNLLRRTDFPF